MKIIKNEKLIARNGKIGNYVSMASLIVLGIGTYISFSQPQLLIYTLLCLLLGFVFSQVGIYMGSRWGRSPRPDEKLDAALKGLHSEFSFHHYTTPVSHFLIGPAGAWVLLPYHQRGQVTYTNGRWRLKGGGFLQGYMRIFGQEGLGRPDADAKAEVRSMQKFLAKRLGKDEVPEVRALIVFTADKIEVDADESPIPALKLKQLKEFIRRESKPRALTTDQIMEITKFFPEQ